MPSSFMALQCFRCSTMQVKQKNSSNNWNCVVCNEKQSVRMVFAQAFMAKDVRKFVQNFNMSRQLSDQKQFHSEELETSSSPKDEQKRKRNDWTEYVDDHDEYCGIFNKDVDLAEGDDGLEAALVTEMPKALFKKPKVMGYSSNRNGAEKLLKPQFTNKSIASWHKNVHSQEWKKPMIIPPLDRPSRWSRLSGQIDDEKNAVGEEEAERLHSKKELLSKWSSFLTDEEADDYDWESRGRGDSQSHYPSESLMNDQRVEDDIHPDFI